MQQTRPGETMKTIRNALLLWAGLFFAFNSWAQAWKPERAIEIITSSDAGGSNDQVARVIQKLLQDAKQAPTPINVMNKPGGNQTIAVVYLNSFATNPHYLLLANPTLFGNQLAGITQTSYSDLTPVVLLLNEHSAISVRAGAPFNTMRDVIDKLKATRESDGGTLFDRTTLAYGSNIQSIHYLDNCPTLITGGGAGVKLGQHLVLRDPKTPLCNLWLTLLRGNGLDAASHGDSTGVIEELLA
jgi:hypothetical protein